jgi:lipopolysaccharide export system protein LptC
MNGRRGRWVLFLVVALGAVASLWLGERTREPAPAAREDPGHVPESVLEDVRLVQYDLQGAVRYRLESPRLVQFLDDRSVEAVTPRIELHSGDQRPLRVRAHHGWMSPRRDRIELRGGVDLRQEDAPGDPGFTARTRRLLVLPHQQVARTADPVTIRGRGFVIEGVGAELLMAEGVLRIHHRVRSRFQRAATPPGAPS